MYAICIFQWALEQPHAGIYSTHYFTKQPPAAMDGNIHFTIWLQFKKDINVYNNVESAFNRCYCLEFT